jgi:hypothetical protein
MSDSEGYDAREAAIIDEINNVEGSDGEEPYNSPHCSTCHFPLAGVGGKQARLPGLRQPQDG